jgi:hypothetical protein
MKPGQRAMTDDDNPFASLFDDRSPNRPHRSLNKDDLSYFRRETIKRKTCSRCGRTFFVVMGGYYCSTRCQQDDRNERRREQRAIEADERKAKRKVPCCEVCGEKLDPTRSTLRFCSNAHRQQAYRNRHKRKLRRKKSAR